MAIILPDDKVVILHPVKTGGTWLKAYLRELGMPFYVTYPRMEYGGFERVVCNKFITHHLAVVPEEFQDWEIRALGRDVIPWYRSFYASYKTTIYGVDQEFGTHEFEATFPRNALESFDNFLMAVKAKYPDGFLRHYFNSFTTYSEMPMFSVQHAGQYVYYLNGSRGTSPTQFPPRNTARVSISLTKKQESDIVEYEQGFNPWEL